MRACQERIDVRRRMFCKHALLQCLMQFLETLRTPQSSGDGGLVGDHTDEKSMLPKCCHRVCRPFKQLNLFRPVHITRLPEIQDTVPIEERYGRIDTGMKRLVRSRLHVRAVHGGWSGWRVMAFVLIWRP